MLSLRVRQVLEARNKQDIAQAHQQMRKNEQDFQQVESRSRLLTERASSLSRYLEREQFSRQGLKAVDLRRRMAFSDACYRAYSGLNENHRHLDAELAKVLDKRKQLIGQMGIYKDKAERLHELQQASQRWLLAAEEAIENGEVYEQVAHVHHQSE